MGHPPDTRTRTPLPWLLGLVAACALQGTARAEEAPATVTLKHTESVEWWRAGALALHAIWSDAQVKVRDGAPDWLRHRSGRRAFDAMIIEARTPAYLMLQEDRPDGTELVTVRYRLDDAGTVRTYAGAGLNRSSWLDGEGEVGPALLAKSDRHDTYGAAAEIGAEILVNERMRLNADLRWVDLDARAEVLRADYGPVAAEPLMLGLSVGYRFR